MYFRMLHDETYGGVSYLLADMEASEAVLVDPRGADMPVLAAMLGAPGHTSGCLSFLWRDRLFCGDLLSVDTCPFQPRPALPEALWNSAMRRVFTLPGETLLFSGHATRGRSVSNVFEQRRWHPWFGGATRDGFLARVHALPPFPGLKGNPPRSPGS